MAANEPGAAGRRHGTGGRVVDAPTGSVIDDGRLRPLSAGARTRYSRNALVPEVGVVGQQRICAGRVLVVGAGALGSPVLLYLAAAGVGRLGVVDDDVVEVSNLQRQVIHTCEGRGQAKVDSVRRALGALNPDVEVLALNERLTVANVARLIAGWDVVVDGTDNFATRYLLNDACVLAGIPLVHGAVFRSDGQVSVFAPSLGGPCYRCLHPVPPAPGSVPSCAEGGVLGVVPGVIGSLQATEVLKLLVGGGRPLIGRVLTVNLWDARTAELTLLPDASCPVCGPGATMTSLEALPDYEALCSVGQDTTASTASAAHRGGGTPMTEITADQLRERLAAGQRIGTDLVVLDVREPHEVELDAIDGSVRIPLGEVVERMGELDPTRTTIVHCAAGVRSARAIEALEAAGYTGELINLAGGMAAWRAVR